MSYQGKVQLTFVIVAPADEVEEGDRLFKSHQEWMKSTHHKSGDKALLSYSVSKAKQLSNPMDTNSAPTGKTCFILNEIYETEAGVADHFKQAADTWEEFPALGKWLGKCEITGVPAASVFNGLW